MKQVFVVCLLISIVAGAPVSEDAQAKIISYENTNDGLGNYEFSFETSNGIQRSESGHLVNIGQSDEHMEVHGVVSYYDPEGKFVLTIYTADADGYHIQKPWVPQVFSSPVSNVVATLLG